MNRSTITFSRLGRFFVDLRSKRDTFQFVATEILNTRDAVLRRLMRGPLTQAEVKTPETNVWLVRLQNEGLVENLYIARGNKTTMTFRLKETK